MGTDGPRGSAAQCTPDADPSISCGGTTDIDFTLIDNNVQLFCRLLHWSFAALRKRLKLVVVALEDAAQSCDNLGLHASPQLCN